ncbi:MAG: rRNA maturation RNase YbeY [Anaeroplasma sp.]
MKINFFDDNKLLSRQYKMKIKSLFKHINTKKTFNIIFVNEEEIQRINREYRKIDKVTDVISFALCDDDEIVQSNELGDVFICVSKAESQAKEYGHSRERELCFLAVHGYLHLCGFDHLTKEEEIIMFTKQEEILNEAGILR